MRINRKHFRGANPIEINRFLYLGIPSLKTEGGNYEALGEREAATYNDDNGKRKRFNVKNFYKNLQMFTCRS